MVHLYQGSKKKNNSHYFVKRLVTGLHFCDKPVASIHVNGQSANGSQA